ncbi:MAG: YvcK family protein [Acidobacteriaceae bacterium]
MDSLQRGGLKVVAIGGGTGLSTILRGLKHFVPPNSSSTTHPAPTAFQPDEPHIVDLTAVVTVTDNGGSSGRLRAELNMLPPGDIRNCLVALSEDEALLARLFQYRFTAGEGLEGHNFGNLFLAALASITGDFSVAVREASEILTTRGHIVPATNADVQLDALMDDNSTVRGEVNITASKKRIVELRMVPANPRPLPETLDAIRDADLITIGPGSLFTSIIPNLLVSGIAEAIANAGAVRVFICNLMTQANESLGLTASQHISTIHQHSGGQRLFDYALLNATPVSPELRQQYATESAEQIATDAEAIEQLGVAPICGPFAAEGRVLRHACDRVARELVALGYRGRPL